MRVITGRAKGRRLVAPRGDQTRPISDRAKEALFSLLGDEIEGARFLDLFAGSGSVGIEALSRGAASATFVERGWRGVKAIRENLKLTGLEGKASVVRADVFRFVAGAEGPYDIVYVAPPQYQALWAKTLLALDAARLLASDALVVAQIFPKEYEELKLERLRFVEERRYGSTMLLFYRLGQPPGG